MISRQKKLYVGAKHKKMFKRRALVLYSMCTVPLLLVFLFSYVPMYGIIIAFKNYNFQKGILGSEWIGLKNFEFFLKSNDFVTITWNTLSMNFLFIIVGSIMAVMVAILFYNIHSRKVVKVYQTMFITPNFISWVLAGYMAYAILHPQYGILNNLLVSLGGKKIDWYSQPGAWPWILMIASVWKGVGMDSVMYYASLMGIDESLFEAAELDGAGKIAIIHHVILPMLLPLISILMILKVGGIFRADFGLFYQLTRDSGALYSTTDVIDTYVYRMMTQVGNMSISTAIGLLQSIVGFITVICVNKISKLVDKDNGLF